jgi:hypothetical protein
MRTCDIRPTPAPIYSESALFRWLDNQFNACSTRASVQIGADSIASRNPGPQLGSPFCLQLRRFGDVHDTSALLLMAEIL